MFKITSAYDHRDKVKVEWNLGKRCNYDCSYCPSSIHDNTSTHTDISILKAAVDKLPNNVRISFTGGEPTVHPNFEELVDYCINVKGIKWINVTTNGTRKSYYYFKLPVHHYVFSLHFEYDWERVLDTIVMYACSDVEQGMRKPCMINVMAHPDKMQEVRKAVSKFDDLQIKYVIRRIRWTNDDHNLFDDMRYDQADLDWLLSKDATVDPNTVITYVDKTERLHANDIIKLHKNQYKGWSCNAGLESLMINWDGDVHRATCRVGGSLGNIYNGTFNIPQKSVICTRDYCTCAADIPLTKLDVQAQETYLQSQSRELNQDL
jgi:MoaA/NifB/PqqE/SkfB family radical SAM enzyme